MKYFKLEVVWFIKLFKVGVSEYNITFSQSVLSKFLIKGPEYHEILEYRLF